MLHEIGSHCGLQNVYLQAIGSNKYDDVVGAIKLCNNDCAYGEEVLAGILSKVAYDFLKSAAKNEREQMRKPLKIHTRFSETMAEIANLSARSEKDYVSSDYEAKIAQVTNAFVTSYRPPETRRY